MNASCSLNRWFSKSVRPLPPTPMKYRPWVALGWFALGVVITGWLAATRPDRVRALGSILAEGEVIPPSQEVEAHPAAPA